MSDRTGLLVELGVEEIPGRMVEDALDQLEDRVHEWARQNRLNDPGNTVRTLGTPRRLVVLGRFPSEQEEGIESIKGPPEDVAYEDGEPTRALEGFCRQHGLDPDDVSVENLDGGRYVRAQKSLPCRSLPNVVEESFAEVFLEMDWPKSMRWEESGTRFIRPIRWLLAAYQSPENGDFLDLTVGPVESDTQTRGLRFTGSETLEFDKPGALFPDEPGAPRYEELLEERAGILLDQEQRRAKIKTVADAKAENVEGEPTYNQKLLDEVTHLVESPTPFLGSFDERFLALPDEVLVESMQSHQKYFPIAGDEGLQPYFIGVRNGTEDHLDTVREGNEKVLRARLNDAEFFYHKDRRTDYEEFREQLDGVVFQEELGSLRDKTQRLAGLVDRFGDRVPPDVDLARVARHAKNDLVTEMVGEFPALQGIMGRVYAWKSGWDEEQAQIIEDYYRPRDREDGISDSPPAQWLAIFDRVDTLVGFFGLGERPSGSADPYGLRRDALGVLRIILDGSLPDDLAISDLIDATIQEYHAMDLTFEGDFQSDLEAFFEERLLNLAESDPDHFEGAGGKETFHRTLRATIPPFWDRPRIAEQRYNWLSDPREEFREGPREEFVEAYQRADNILRGEEELPDRVEEARFEDPAEARLQQAAEDLRERLDEHLSEGNSGEVFLALWELIDPINKFFEAVMVHAEDPGIRHNRLRLLEEVRDQCRRVADFSVL